MTPTEVLFVPDKRTLILRGIRGLCPNCGKGALFKSYLKQNDACSICSEDFSRIRADDGPAWLTILLTLHIIVPISVAVAMSDVLPQTAEITLMLILTVATAMLLLPRAKGVFIAVLWYLSKKRQREHPHRIAPELR
jgi:uncharacterized protein (DUF983 family)